MRNFTGNWQTTFGPMNLVQDGDNVEGAYNTGGAECPISGTVEGNELTFTYQEGEIEGEGSFELNSTGDAFTGQYRAGEDEEWSDWEGTRIGFDGLWETSFGLLRLIEEGELVRGYYEPAGVVQGSLSGDKLTLTYREPEAGGKACFTLAEDAMSFDGEWQAEGSNEWEPWTGERVLPKPDLTWLVVVEAPWQKSLMEREYSFGSMLWEFFARLDNVEVRQRYFANEESLRQYCREVMYLAEPVYLWLATHALPDGIRVNGKTIAVPPLLEYLRHVPDLQLVHMSACLLMQDDAMRSLLQTFSNQNGVPISGYATSIDWGEGAVLEFTYLELILSKGYTPEEAAEELHRLLPFAGDEGDEEGVFPPAGFRLLTPE